MKTAFFLLGLIGIILTSCTNERSKTESKSKVWKYDHERTKEKIAEIYAGAGKDLTDNQLDKMVVHFKKHPPELRLNKTSFEMVRLVKKTGFFSGGYKNERQPPDPLLRW